jgi:hypothetical protein
MIASRADIIVQTSRKGVDEPRYLRRRIGPEREDAIEIGAGFVLSFRAQELAPEKEESARVLWLSFDREPQLGDRFLAASEVHEIAAQREMPFRALDRIEPPQLPLGFRPATTALARARDEVSSRSEIRFDRENFPKYRFHVLAASETISGGCREATAGAGSNEARGA